MTSKLEMLAGRELIIKQETLDRKMCKIQAPALCSLSILVLISLALNCLVQ